MGNIGLMDRDKLLKIFEYLNERLMKSKDLEFMDSLNEPVDLDLCSNEELKYLTKVSAIIDYYLQLQGKEVPDWLRDEKLSFPRPYYHSKRLSDLDKFKLQYTFKARNVYFDLEGLKRI